MEEAGNKPENVSAGTTELTAPESAGEESRSQSEQPAVELAETDLPQADQPQADQAQSDKAQAAQAEAAAGTEEASKAEPAEAEKLPGLFEAKAPAAEDDTELKAVVEAIVYVADEPVSAAQIAAAIQRPEGDIRRVLNELIAEYAGSAHGITVREVAGGFKMTTKPEHHETIRAFVKSLKPPLKLSLAALETLAVIAYKQPITAPEIMEIRGVQGTGVLKTLLDHKLIQTSGRKNVVGRPILYKTTKEFLVQFGLKDLSELPTLKEFEELRRLAVDEPETAQAAPQPETAQAEPEPETAQAAPEPETAQTAPEPETAQAAPQPETPQTEPEETPEPAVNPDA
ncbi:MAG: SMC-Scp complex subunit ScpB [Rhodospirillales bacterium]